MSSIFHFSNDEKILSNDISVDIDELYEKQKTSDLKKLEIYNKILNKIHNKIKIQARLCKNEQWCWYQIPSVLIGVPEYNFITCINFIIEKLNDNGFLVNFYKPNLLLISWKDWIPEYVREQIYFKLGKKIDSHGNILKDENKDENHNKDTEKNSENNYKKSVTFKSVNDVVGLSNKVYDIKVIEKLDKINN